MKKKSKPKKKASVPHPVSGLTVVQEKQKIKGALRQMWRKSSRAHHIKSVRFPHPDVDSRFKYAVTCEECHAIFGQSEKTFYKTKSGRRRRTGAYQVDHISPSGLPPINDLVGDLGYYAEALIHTPLRILCVSCHKAETKLQMENRHSK